MSRETKRPRITRPSENRDENRRSRTQHFENREGGESETRRPNRFDSDRPRREQGYGYIRDLNKEREGGQGNESGNRDNGNRYHRDSDRNRERGERDGNRYESRERGERDGNRYENRDNRRSYERGSRDNNRFSDRGDRRERRPQDRNENFERRDNRYQNRERNDQREGERRENNYRGDGERRERNYREDGERRERNYRDNGERRERSSRGDGENRENYRGERRNYNERDNRRERFSDRPARRSFTPRNGENDGPKSVYSKKKQIEYRKKNEGQETELRLNRYIAKGGVCSRRDADVLITEGRVKVNGVVVRQVGVKVKRTDTIEVDDQVITPERKVYLILNKPKDYVTTVEDPLERKTVMSLIEGACKERVYPIGRLDRQTTGVLLFTNDGDLAKKLTHPKYNQKKIYHVFLDKVVQQGDLEAICKGIELEDGFIQADDVKVADDDRTQVGIEIHSGRNRIVRRIFEHLGYQILRLDRVFFAGITKKNLPRGRWRFLTQDEINILKAY